MTPEERAKIGILAKRAGLSNSAYLVHCALAPKRGGRGPDAIALLARCDLGLRLLERIAVAVESADDPDTLRCLRRLEIMEGHLSRTVAQIAEARR